jgi:hypothetical protein
MTSRWGHMEELQKPRRGGPSGGGGGGWRDTVGSDPQWRYGHRMVEIIKEAKWRKKAPKM